MLIMVDGHRTGNELVALSSSSAEGKRHLASLLNGGFVQVQPAPGSRAEQVPDARPALPDEDISLARSYAARTLMDLLGRRLPRWSPKSRKRRRATNFCISS
jgi:hypothetical protein